MSLSEQQKTDLCDFIQAIQDNELSKERYQELVNLLRDSKNARLYYIQLMSIQSHLKHRYTCEQALLDTIKSASSDEQPHTQSIDALNVLSMIAQAENSRPLNLTNTKSASSRTQTIQKVDTRKLWFSLISAAAIAIILIPALIMLFNTGDSNHKNTIKQVVLAKLNYSKEAMWIDLTGNNIKITDGDNLLKGPLRLEKGLAKITMNSGAYIVLDARQKAVWLQLVDNAVVYLDKGKVVGTKSKYSEGLVVNINGFTIADLGTQFGVTVRDDGKNEVHVFEGSVQLNQVDKNGNAGDVYDLFKGQAAQVTTNGDTPVSFIEVDQKSYLRDLVPEPHLDAPRPSFLRDVYVAYQTPLATKGNQPYTGSLGMDFVVNKTIKITRLGTFDQNRDGISGNVEVMLWKRNDNSTPDNFKDDTGAQIVAKVVITGNAGELLYLDRFVKLEKEVELQPGAYTIVARGYGPKDPVMNAGEPSYRKWTPHITDGGGAISFVGVSRYSTEAKPFPDELDTGPANRYCAGTFEYVVESKND